jgi:hypothetical protein
MYRTREGYNPNRSFKLSFAFAAGYGTAPEGYIFMSLGGNTSLTTNNQIPTGLAFGYNNDGVFRIYNNGTSISSAYSIGNNQKYYAFIKKLGNTIYYTVNQTGVEPATYDYSVTVAGTIAFTSNALIIYAYGNTRGDGNSSAGYQVWPPSILLY